MIKSIPAMRAQKKEGSCRGFSGDVTRLLIFKQSRSETYMRASGQLLYENIKSE